MALNTQGFTTMVQNMVASIQGRAAKLVDFSVGSILRALVEAVAAIVLWLQGLILQLLATTRAASSSGADLDSWMADYGFTRLPAISATGTVTVGRYTSTAQAILPVGSLFQTQDGSQQYAVTIDTTNTAYNATFDVVKYPSGVYVLPTATTSISAPVKAVIAGAAGNAAIGQINTLGQALPGIDTVTNAAAFTNGADAESDAAFRARFVLYLGSLAKATMAAVGAAVKNVQQGISYTIVENVDVNGATKLGYFYVVVDDGTGNPPSSFISSVYNAVDAVRPLTVTFTVIGPTLLTTNVSLTATIATGYDPVATKALVNTAITNYLNKLPLGTGLPYTKIAQIAYEASSAVTNVSGVLVNGATSDIAGTPKQILKAGTITVN